MIKELLSRAKITKTTKPIDISAKYHLFQEHIRGSVQFSHCVCETGFSQVGLFLDNPFPRIGFGSPITSNWVINSKLLMCIHGNSSMLEINVVDSTYATNHLDQSVLTVKSNLTQGDTLGTKHSCQLTGS